MCVVEDCGQGCVDEEVATLTAERDNLQLELDGVDVTLRRQATQLTGVVNAIKGQPPELVHWSHHDAAELAQNVVKERDALRTALERIAFEDDLVYMGCSDIPACSGGSGRKHADDCVIGVAREALGGKS